MVRHRSAIFILTSIFLVWQPECCVAQDSPREVRALAQQALMKGEYETAATYLIQLTEWYKDSEDEKTIAGMEMVYFNLGLCYYLTGQFGTAERRFGEYLKRYPKGMRAPEASVFIGDAQRYSNDLDKAVKTYEATLEKYDLDSDWTTDVLCSMARCALAQDDWETALPILEKARVVSPDWRRKNWAATLLTTAYLKEFELEKVFDLVPYLMQRGSFASRSIAFNMAALESADLLFADERYREALWLYRLVYPKEMIERQSRIHLARLQDEAEYLREASGLYRELLRTQEAIGEVEAELEALKEVENYDLELFFRIARSYMETRRYREARRVFLYLHEEADAEQAEEALFLAFHCSTMLKPWDKAFELGHRYMEEYPGGEYYDGVSLAVGQLYAMLQDWPNVIAVLTKALEVSPKHESVAECMFLVGYAHFMEEHFSQSVGWLKRLNENYPGNDREEEANYWIGMGLLFDTKYELALDAFNFFLATYPESTYAEDATFRRAVSAYGLSDYRVSETMLSDFIAAYPDSKLRGEATMMLGDVSGFFGELEAAVARYQEALNYELNIEFYNHCSFKCGEILNDDGRFGDLVGHFRAYIERNREGSNIPQAIHWVVRGLWMQGEREGALSYFLDGVRKYGAERSALGVDVLLEEWVGLSRKLEQEAERDAWRELMQIMTEAASKGSRTLELRLRRLLLYRQGIEESERNILLDELIREDNIAHASPAVLELIMDEAEKRGEADLSLAAAHEMVSAFPETDYGISARMKIAKAAMAERDWDTVKEQLSVVIEVFAASQEAAQALYMMAQMHMERRQYDKAEECFTDILGVREWRGPLWPAAIYGRAECARLRRRYDKAAALYERIYLLYSNYTDWAAKAYLRRAECLLRLRRTREAREVLNALLSEPEFEGLEQQREARTLLAKIDGTL